MAVQSFNLLHVLKSIGKIYEIGYINLRIYIIDYAARTAAALLPLQQDQDQAPDLQAVFLPVPASAAASQAAVVATLAVVAAGSGNFFPGTEWFPCLSKQYKYICNGGLLPQVY